MPKRLQRLKTQRGPDSDSRENDTGELSAALSAGKLPAFDRRRSSRGRSLRRRPSQALASQIPDVVVAVSGDLITTSPSPANGAAA